MDPNLLAWLFFNSTHEWLLSNSKFIIATPRVSQENVYIPRISNDFYNHCRRLKRDFMATRTMGFAQVAVPGQAVTT